MSPSFTVVTPSYNQGQFIRETIAVLDAMDLSDADRDAIYFGNAEAMLSTDP